jgi:dipeptidyl aminopeptidase/acylaminoacyl peptidase
MSHAAPLRAGLALLVAAVLLPAGTGTAQDKGKPGKSVGWTPEASMKVKSIGSVRVSPDGKKVAFTVREAVTDGDKSEYLTHIHVSNSDGSGAFQLTQGDKSCDGPQWSPDGERIGFLSGRSGKNNVWLIRLRGGEATRLTDAKAGVSSFKFSPDGKTIAFTALDPPTKEEEKKTKSKNDARVLDENIKLNRLYLIPVEKDSVGERETLLLTKGNYNVGSLFGPGGFDWSPDGQEIAFTHTRTPRPDDWPTADVSVVDVKSLTVTPLATTGAAEHSPLYSPDGKWIACVVSDDPPTWGFTAGVRVYPANGGTPRQLAATGDRQPFLIGWSADGTRLYYSEARGTTSQLFALPLNGEPRQLSHIEGGLYTPSLNRARTRFGFGMQTTTQPAEAYASPAESFQPVRVSQVNEALPKHPLGRTEVLSWNAADGLKIEGLLTYPVGYEKGKRYPLLLMIHGGPAGVFSQSFTAGPALYPVATFAAKGYAVLRTNPRGSSGYGQPFRYANYKDWGGGDYKDIMAGVDHVIKLGVADPDRMGVMGWSYGGYMTSWVITQTQRFKAASVGAGVTNLVSFTGTADIPGFLPDYFGGEMWDRVAVYQKHSAMFHVKGVRTPTLIQHGEKDDRVPISQGYELYNALKRQGCTTKMVVYPRTPHGPNEPRLLLDVMNRNVEWFDRYVK